MRAGDAVAEEEELGAGLAVEIVEAQRGEPWGRETRPAVSLPFLSFSTMSEEPFSTPTVRRGMLVSSLEAQRDRLIAVDAQLGTDEAVAVAQHESLGFHDSDPRPGLSHEGDGHETKDGSAGHPAPAAHLTLEACHTGFDSVILRSAHSVSPCLSRDGFRRSGAV